MIQCPTGPAWQALIKALGGDEDRAYVSYFRSGGKFEPIFGRAESAGKAKSSKPSQSIHLGSKMRLGVQDRDVSRVLRSPLVQAIPALRKTTIGKFADILADENNGLTDAERGKLRKQDQSGEGVADGFHASNGKNYVFTDKIAVRTNHGSGARALAKVLVHENTHSVIDFIKANRDNPEYTKLADEWGSMLKDAKDATLESFLKRNPGYEPHYGDWKTSPKSRDTLVEEWLAEKRSADEVARLMKADSVFARFIQWVKDVFAKLTGTQASMDDITKFIQNLSSVKTEETPGEGKLSLTQPDDEHDRTTGLLGSSDRTVGGSPHERFGSVIDAAVKQYGIPRSKEALSGGSTISWNARGDLAWHIPDALTDKLLKAGEKYRKGWLDGEITKLRTAKALKDAWLKNQTQDFSKFAESVYSDLRDAAQPFEKIKALFNEAVAEPFFTSKESVALRKANSMPQFEEAIRKRMAQLDDPKSHDILRRLNEAVSSRNASKNFLKASMESLLGRSLENDAQWRANLGRLTQAVDKYGPKGVMALLSHMHGQILKVQRGEGQAPFLQALHDARDGRLGPIWKDLAESGSQSLVYPVSKALEAFESPQGVQTPSKVWTLQNGLKREISRVVDSAILQRDAENRRAAESGLHQPQYNDHVTAWHDAMESLWKAYPNELESLLAERYPDEYEAGRSDRKLAATLKERAVEEWVSENVDKIQDLNALNTRKIARGLFSKDPILRLKEIGAAKALDKFFNPILKREGKFSLGEEPDKGSIQESMDKVLSAAKTLEPEISAIWKKWGFDVGTSEIHIGGGRAKGKPLKADSDIDVFVKTERAPQIKTADQMENRNEAMREINETVWKATGEQAHVVQHGGIEVGEAIPAKNLMRNGDNLERNSKENNDIRYSLGEEPEADWEVEEAKRIPNAKTASLYRKWMAAVMNHPDIQTAATQVLGQPNGEKHIVQSIAPVVLWAKQLITGQSLHEEGGADDAYTSGGSIKVTSEHTDKVLVLASKLYDKGFADKAKKNFQDTYSPKNELGQPMHKGDVVAAVLQMEMMDYYTAAQAEMDKIRAQTPKGTNSKEFKDAQRKLNRIRSRMEEFANEVVLGSQTMSSAARALQVRSMATKVGSEKAFWNALALMKRGMGEAAADHINKILKVKNGKAILDRMMGSIEDPALHAMMAKQLGFDDPEGKEIAKAIDNPDAAEQEKADKELDERADKENWDAALEILDPHEQGLIRELETYMDELGELAKLQDQLEAASRAKDEGQKFALSEDERKDLSSDPDKLKAQIADKVANIKRILKALNAEDAPASTKTQRTRTANKLSKIKNQPIKSQVEGELKRFADRESRKSNINKAKKTEPEWKKDYQNFIKNDKPQSKADFVSMLVDQYHLPVDLAEKLHEQAKALRERREQADYEKKARGEAKDGTDLTKEDEQAQSFIDKFQEEQTEWKPLDPTQGDTMGKMVREAIKDPGYNQPARGKEQFEDYYSDRLRKLGATDERAKVLSDLLWEENRKAQTNREARARERAVKSKAFLNSLVQSLFSASKVFHQDPDWRHEQAVEAFRKAGFTKANAEKAADWFASRFNKKWEEVQRAAVKKAGEAQKLPFKSIERIQQAIRADVYDPRNPVARALAEEAGFKGLTDDDNIKLAQLDQKMNGAGPTEVATLLGQMEHILTQNRPDRSFREMVAQSYVNTALGSLGTMGLHYTQPAFAMAVRGVTEITGILGDVTTGKYGWEKAGYALQQTFKNFLGSYEGYIDSIKDSYKNETYTTKYVEALGGLTSLRQELDRSTQALFGKDSTPSERLAAFPKFILSSTDLTHRVLLSGVEASGRTLQNFLTRQASLRGMLERADMTLEQAAAVFSDAQILANKEFEMKVARGYTPAQAHGISIDAMNQFIRENVGNPNLTPEQINEYAVKDMRMEVGSREPELGATFDVFNHIAEMAKVAASMSRKKHPLLGRIIFGFLSVPSNLASRALSFSPYGLYRAHAAAKDMKSGEARKFYTETIKNNLQLQQRWMEGILGTAALATGAALVYSQDDKGYNHYTGLRVTLAGPQNQNLKQAWLQNGNQENSIEWVQDGKVVGALGYARGGPESIKVPLVLIGAYDDMRLNNKLHSQSTFDTLGAWGHTAVAGGFKAVSLFGLKNLGEIAQLQDRSEDSLIRNIAWTSSAFIPWSGFLKSVQRIGQEPLDNTSATEALKAQVPFVSLSGPPARNYLGDTKYSSDAGGIPTRAGFPIYISTGPTGQNADLYRFFVDRMVSPSAPSRRSLEQKNAIVTDAQWSKYVQTRGEIIKAEMRPRLAEFRRMDDADLAREISRIDANATRASKEKLGLR